MSGIEWAIVWSALGLGFFHTVIGPDHYVPFIALARARNWNLRKTLTVTGICGIGHVSSSILIGAAGVILGYGLNQITPIELTRGDMAGWAMILFGAAYLVFGIVRAIQRKPHKHIHLHGDGSRHVHEHVHAEGHDHEHRPKVTPWILFLIFVLGPCEVFIPMLFYPAANSNTFSLAAVSIAFLLSTVGTMLLIVYLAYKGLSMMRFGWMERWMHVMAGGIIVLSGLAIILGL